MAEPTTIIGEFTTVHGNLQGDEDLVVYGRVDGSIQLERTLMIEPSGVVKADVTVRNAVISGIVVGNVEATESVQLTAEGRMVGDISSPRVIIVEGALFRGRVDMGEVEPQKRDGREPQEEKPAAPRAPTPARARELPRPAPAPRKTTRSKRAEPAPAPAARPQPRRPSHDEEEEPEAKVTTRRRPATSKPPTQRSRPPKADEPADSTDAEPPPPKPRVPAKKRRVSVKKR